MVEISPELVLQAYAAGVFPMAEAREEERLYWVDPERRGILPLDEFHISRRLRRTILSERFEVRVDTCFQDVIEACAASENGREGTWINDQIVDLFTELNRQGYAHSIECFRDGALVGGLYGVAIGGAFFGESMFTRVNDASKIALVHLVARLIIAGYQLLDTQFVTDHLRQFGAREVARETYHRLLNRATAQSADFSLGGWSPSPSVVLQSITQTS